jgi:hypothetical protein
VRSCSAQICQRGDDQQATRWDGAESGAAHSVELGGGVGGNDLLNVACVVEVKVGERVLAVGARPEGESSQHSLHSSPKPKTSSSHQVEEGLVTQTHTSENLERRTRHTTCGRI